VERVTIQAKPIDGRQPYVNSKVGHPKGSRFAEAQPHNPAEVVQEPPRWTDLVGQSM
jgi:hypothetical protein